MTAGRPTEYTPALGELILAKMEEGLSLTAAAGECDVHRQRVYEWEKIHPEFGELVSIARTKRQAFLERRLLKETYAGPQITSTIFALKNANPAEWSDRTSHELSGPNGGAIPISAITRTVVDPGRESE